MKTAECVTPKHPDKMCDQISDAILDWCLSEDPMARVAVETMGGHGRVMVMGEITMAPGKGHLLSSVIPRIVREVTGKDDIKLDIELATQSAEIAQGVDTGGAGDQGIMVGYACRDNEALIPQELYLSRLLAKHLYEIYPYDGKTQVTLDENNQVITIVASFQNAKSAELREAVYAWIEKEGIECTPDVSVYANPAGDWNMGGFDADTGLTGRKLAVDNYGPQIPVGGGAFSGKDATKVDRSAAYMARFLAVTYLKGYSDAQAVTVKLAYAIGKREPVMATAEILYTDGVKKLVEIQHNEALVEASGNLDMLTPKGMIDFLELRAPQFERTACWGHFGNGFRWDIPAQ